MAAKVPVLPFHTKDLKRLLGVNSISSFVDRSFLIYLARIHGPNTQPLPTN